MRISSLKANNVSERTSFFTKSISILQFVIVESNDENHSTICSSKNEKGKLQNQNFVPN